MTLDILVVDDERDIRELVSGVLSDEGYAELQGVMASDGYLEDLDGGGLYGQDFYYLAIFGQPSANGDWMLQFNGHHLAHNITFRASGTQPTPNHFGAEPKGEFSIGGESYTTILDEG